MLKGAEDAPEMAAWPETMPYVGVRLSTGAGEANPATAPEPPRTFASSWTGAWATGVPLGISIRTLPCMLSLLGARPSEALAGEKVKLKVTGLPTKVTEYGSLPTFCRENGSVTLPPFPSVA